MKSNENTFRKSLIFLSLAAFMVSAILILLEVVQVLLLVFAGIVLSVFFRGLANLIRKFLRIKEKWALVAAIAGLIVIIVTGAILLGPATSDSTSKLMKEIPDAVERFKERIIQYSWGEDVLKNVGNSANEYIQNEEFRKRVTGIFSSILTVISGILVIIVTGLYISFSPKEYSYGFIKLFPRNKRDRVFEILSKL